MLTDFELIQKCGLDSSKRIYALPPPPELLPPEEPVWAEMNGDRWYVRFLLRYDPFQRGEFLIITRVMNKEDFITFHKNIGNIRNVHPLYQKSIEIYNL